MENAMIIAVVAIVALLGVREAMKHFKGQGGCCGGGTYTPKAKKLDKVVAQKTVRIDGMTCEHCRNRVHEAFNDIEGVSAEVDHKKGRAIVFCDRVIDDAVICAAVQKAGYKVSGID